jgi:uncharacterized membrane protein YraQ (UPF0718 family)
LNRDEPQSAPWKRRMMWMLLFPASVFAIYGILFAFMPDRASMALRNSGHVFLKIIVPLSLVFILMLALNLFLKPAHTVKFIGKGLGIKGIILTATAGIISIGPIYAWYPLLKELREKGVGNPLIAIFLNNRAVKPFLLPMMIAYFGWTYVLILTVFTILGSLGVGYAVYALVKEKTSLSFHV